jgi:ubiquinone/menaquinone biosynthesis C-methylase UbiE
MLQPTELTEILSQGFTDRLFPPRRQLIPDIDDSYEIELAFYENQILDDAGLIRNAGYFARVGQEYTRHFLMCTGEPLRLPNHSSSRLKSFFEKNIFRTGYATHGLFPYRGKFHPQMVKGLLNIMGLRPGDTVLDPMMGSGTVPVEACLMGIRSVGIDASPFCRFMAQTKVDALTMSLRRAQQALRNCDEVFAYFKSRVGVSDRGRKTRKPSASRGFMSVMESAAEYVAETTREGLTGNVKETSDTYNFLLLAYLDAAGYSERSERKSPEEQFRAILERYLFVADKIQRVLQGVEGELGEATLMEGDARSLRLDNASVDGVIFSPPYSFAIDYLDNDAFHLHYLGADTTQLQEIMVGLRGRDLQEKFAFYKEDMGRVLAECARVLRPQRVCTIVVGTNNNQLSKVLGVSPDQVPGLHQILIETAGNLGLKLVRTMSRSIVGISNTMRREYILLLQKR